MSLPRWIMAPHVDSTAMLSAFLRWKYANHDEWLELGMELTIIQHSLPGFATPTEDLSFLVHVPCAVPALCNRCRQRRMGYTFRWLGPQWAAEYERTKKAGSWSCTDPEGMPQDVAPGFRGQIYSSTGAVLLITSKP